MVTELTGTLPSFFAGPKTETLIFQYFYFTKTAKNAIFSSLPLRSGYNSDKWRFNAWFMPIACHSNLSDFPTRSLLLLSRFCCLNVFSYLDCSLANMLNQMSKRSRSNIVL